MTQPEELQAEINDGMLALIHTLKERVEGLESSQRNIIEAVRLMNQHTHSHPDEDDDGRC